MQNESNNKDIGTLIDFMFMLIYLQVNNKHQTTKTAPIKTAHNPNDKQISTAEYKTAALHERIPSPTKPNNEGRNINDAQMEKGGKFFYSQGNIRCHSKVVGGLLQNSFLCHS